MTMPEHDHDKRDDLGFALPEPARVSPTRLLAIGAGLAVVVVAAFLIGWMPKHRAQKDLAAETHAAAAEAPRVQVVTAKVNSSDKSLGLPGSIQPLEETVVYPRASGYVKKWYVDIGDKVKEGDLLADIDTPELDQQLIQARAELARAEAGLVQSQANADYSKTNLQRYEQLAPAGVASQQELDKEKAQSKVDDANMVVAKANVDSNKAAIGRLMELKSFARVTAPFAGTITLRSVDRGALVSAGNGTPLFKISNTDPVRVIVQVPQDVAPSVRADVPAKVMVREYAGRTFDGRVARSAGALDPSTRTMTTEVRVPNPKGELFAGMYAQVELTLPSPHKVYEVPATALLNDAKGLRLAIVTPESKIHLVPVVVERDNGATIDLASGIDGTERIVKLGSPDLVEGAKVDVQK
jgi:RND family efflux transporter MFP subunit